MRSTSRSRPGSVSPAWWPARPAGYARRAVSPVAGLRHPSALAAGPVDAHILLRPAGPVEQARLFAWHEAAFREHIEALWGWDADDQERDFWRLFVRLPPLVVCADRVDVGYLQTLRRSGAVHLANIVLRGPARGRGIGSALIAHIQRVAAAADSAVTLKVFRSNARALAFYRRAGFVEDRPASATHYLLRWAPPD